MSWRDLSAFDTPLGVADALEELQPDLDRPEWHGHADVRHHELGR